MKKNLIKENYKKKIKLLDYYNQKYFNENISEITDAEFDELKREIISLENEHKFLKNKNSPSIKVGHLPSKIFKKIAHKIPMLSLSNAFNEKDLINFEKKILNYLNQANDYQIEFSAEPKIDGISSSLIYENGKFITGLSRGDGKEGRILLLILKQYLIFQK